MISNHKKIQIKLLAQLRDAIQELETLVIRINKTNNETEIKEEGSLMEALAKRDSFKNAC